MLLNHIYSGDCNQVLRKEIEPGSVNLIFSDPPYNLSGEALEWKEKGYSKVNEAWDKMDPKAYIDFTNQWISASYDALTDNGSIFVCCSKHNLSAVDTALRSKGFEVNNIITWFKTNAMPNMTGRMFTHSSEFIIWAVKGPGWVYNRQEAKNANPDRTKEGAPKAMRDVWFIPFCNGKERIKGSDGKSAHKTQKPEQLVERCVRICSNPGDLVLDPFLGSGTTAVVAQRLGRNWIGIELDESSVQISKDRLAMLQASAEHTSK